MSVVSRIQQWLGRNQQTAALSPHERWPEILHWRQGDKFDPHVNDRGCHYHSLRLIALTEDGFAYCKEGALSDRKVKVRIASLVGHNESIVTRMVDNELQRSNEYMDLIKQFSVAYEELRERDKRMRVAS